MDVVIVGAGLAGLHCALRISERYPRQRIVVLESYSMAGGRVSTFTRGKVHWEAGAGRIPESHRIISSYCDRYALTRFPISSDAGYVDKDGIRQNIWNSIVTSIQRALSRLPSSVLGHYTMYDVLRKLYDKETVDDFISYFPYRSEITTMRADLAFSKEFSAAESFYGIKEGLSALIHHMTDDLRKRGVNILYKHRVTGLGTQHLFPMHLHCMTPHGMKTFTAGKIIFAVQSNALRTIRPFSTYPILKHLKMTPLLRTYAIFPHTNKVWFDDLSRLVTRGSLRHIIPINAKEGVIMTSYTDEDDTRVWNAYRKKGDTCLTKALLKELRALFPSKTIPNPLYATSHYWEEGCTYWIPGSYSPVKESTAIMQPFPNRFPDVHVCGESYSMKQAWMEGALEHADAMLHTFFFRGR